VYTQDVHPKQADPVSTMPPAVVEVVETALGREHRDDRALPRTGGPAGNAALTAWTGIVLLVLFVAECVTLLSLHQLISWHIVLGTVLVPVALLKTATTGWRIVRYYAGSDAYVAAGPPPLLLRLLGPLVVLTALAVLGSGLALVATGSDVTPFATLGGFSVDAVTVHKACFVLWLVVVGAHTLVRLVPAFQLAARTGPRRRAVDGAWLRGVAVVLSLAVGVGAGAVVLSASGAWTHGWFGQFRGDDTSR
jgi:hypothetical protein